jgi:hypothetical protein
MLCVLDLGLMPFEVLVLTVAAILRTLPGSSYHASEVYICIFSRMFLVYRL